MARRKHVQRLPQRAGHAPQEMHVQLDENDILRLQLAESEVGRMQSQLQHAINNRAQAHQIVHTKHRVPPGYVLALDAIDGATLRCPMRKAQQQPQPAPAPAAAPTDEPSPE